MMEMSINQPATSLTLSCPAYVAGWYKLSSADHMDRSVNREGLIRKERGSMRVFLWCFVVLCCLPQGVSAAADDSASDVSETARLLAILLDSGRVAIGRNQALINDPENAQTAFTQELFATHMTAIFKERTGHNLDDLPSASVPALAKRLLERLLLESKKTVESFQPVLKMKGLKYKGLIPATFGTEAATRFQKWSGVYLKQTAPEHLLRNANNKPDSFEVEHMKELSAATFQGNQETVISKIEGGNSVRVLLPLFYEKACLSCHGEPKGERDLTGYSKEGGKEGQLGGAISVKIEMNQLAVR
ncbi:MAG: DUF3365 domain-containing protein [Nitrospira sp. CR1.1]|nr:DUF3365 domain-containing protein [Nitrospira sp. CR1.1]